MTDDITVLQFTTRLKSAIAYSLLLQQYYSYIVDNEDKKIRLDFSALVRLASNIYRLLAVQQNETVML
jgi:hypothetical protein